MGWVMLSLRRNELQTDISDMQMQLVQLSNKRDDLTSLSNAIGDGHITPSEIASIGSEFFGDALDFMGYSHDAALELSQEQTDYYSEAYSTVTAEQYYNNPAIGAQASLYFDESGSLDLERMQSEFYEEALEEFVQTYMMPKINELEKAMQAEQTELETQIQAKEAELETVKQSISSGISQTTIQLG